MAATPFVDFSGLPVNKNGPHGNAWGLWGVDDQLGTLNYLTDDVVKNSAKKEIRTGKRVSLNWSMMGPSNPRFARMFTEVKLINKAPLKIAHDEELYFNTQISSQWDGTRHYGYQEEKVYFMGHTAEEFEKSDVNGLQTMARKGIAGRGVLIDWYRWMEEEGHKDIDAFSAYGITFDSLMLAAKAQGLSLSDFREGDILFVRSGYIHQYDSMSPKRRRELHEVYQKEKPKNIGLEPSKELLEFFWNNRFAAVAGDTRLFEKWPCTEAQWHLHEWLLAGWGMPIGELFDLEHLSTTCQELGRYTFFISSEPLNVAGGVASPPNALAFF